MREYPDRAVWIAIIYLKIFEVIIVGREDNQDRGRNRVVTLKPLQNGGAEEAMPRSLSAFARTSLVDLVTREIRAAIFSGRYAPGQKLIVREISESFGVSHTPVKDALNRLISEGLVQAFPNRSMVVREVSSADYVEGLSIRLMCEVFCAAEIVRGVAEDPTLLQDLEQSWATMDAELHNADSVDYEKWVAAESAFHRRYMLACGNDRLIALYSSLDSNRIAFFAYLDSRRTPLKRRIFESNCIEHREIITALTAGDTQRFRRAVATHLIRASDDYGSDHRARESIARLRRLAADYSCIENT